MLSKKQNELVTRIGAGTSMGEVIRRYWIPALLSKELPEPDCPPVRVQLLGESLVAFRDSNGDVGLSDEFCPHRGTSLYFGRNEECGLRCIYHGWKFDVNGKLLETPAEPSGVDFRHKVNHTSYPCIEVAGMVWTYMGPKEEDIPLFPNYEWAQVPSSHTYVTKSILECNYLQGLEGECDSSHVSFLHRVIKDNPDPSYELQKQDGAPRYETETTDYGVRLIAFRNAGPENTYIRISNIVMPISCFVPAARLTRETGGYAAHFYVPINDYSTWRYDLVFRRNRPINEKERNRENQVDSNFRRFRNMDNDYLQDREMQKTVNFTGIDNYLNHDACATESMGPIMDRSKEFLGVSDRGVIALRRFLLKAIELFQNGEPLPHVVRDPEKNEFKHTASIAEIIPKGSDWRKELELKI